jgi:hypothetical protein
MHVDNSKELNTKPRYARQTEQPERAANLLGKGGDDLPISPLVIPPSGKKEAERGSRRRVSLYGRRPLRGKWLGRKESMWRLLSDQQERP